MSTETSEETLSNFFKENNFSLKKTKFLLDTNGKSKGAGFVELHDASQAAEAVKQLSGKAVDGNKVIVQIAK